MDRVDLREPAGKTVRAVVRQYLADTVRAAARLASPSDVEALHDVRVALRRLRVALRAYAPELKPGVPKGLRTALGALATQTGSARDAEVFIEWLRTRLPRLTPGDRVGATWLMDRAVAHRDAAYRAIRRFVPRALGMIEPLLRAGLGIPSRMSSQRGRTFGAVTARRVSEQLDDLVGALRKVKGPSDDEAAHRARIAAKKVRYLLEPVLTRQGSGILKMLKVFQDALGEFHDLGGVGAQVLRSRRTRGRGPEDGATPERLAGLPRILAIAERERTALFRRIRGDYLLDPAAWLLPVRRWVQRHENAAPAAAPSMGGADILVPAHRVPPRAR